jgi:hypothetical protein
MPDSTISAPVAADSIDRLALGATDARAATHYVFVQAYGLPVSVCNTCMAEE